jgi:hypothetical protein
MTMMEHGKKLGHWFWSIACTNPDHDMSKRLNKRQQREQEELELLKGQQEQVRETQEEEESEEESDGGIVNPFAAVSRGWGLLVGWWADWQLDAAKDNLSEEDEEEDEEAEVAVTAKKVWLSIGVLDASNDIIEQEEEQEEEEAGWCGCRGWERRPVGACFEHTGNEELEEEEGGQGGSGDGWSGSCIGRAQGKVGILVVWTAPVLMS